MINNANTIHSHAEFEDRFFVCTCISAITSLFRFYNLSCHFMVNTNCACLSLSAFGLKKNRFYKTKFSQVNDWLLENV